MNSPSSIRAVTFDVGGTLIEPWPSVGHVYSVVAAECGAGNFPPDLLTERFIAAWNAKSSFDYSIGAWRRLVAATFAEGVPEPRSEEVFRALYQRFEQPEAWRVFEDVIPTLRELRGTGLKLGIISNWDERLRPLLHRLELAEWFETMTISIEARAHKPSAPIFEQAALALGVPPESILHVGDSPGEDLRGARSAGFQALLLDRRAANSRAMQSLWALPSMLATACSPPPPN